MSLFEGLSFTNFFNFGEKFSKLMHAHWRKIYPNLLGLPTCAWSCANFLFHFGGILLKQSEISPRWAGSLHIWTHFFLYSFLKKVRSRLGEATRKIGSAQLHVSSPLIASKLLLFTYIDVSKEKWWVWKKIEAHLPQSPTQRKQVTTTSTIVQPPPWNFSKTFQSLLALPLPPQAMTAVQVNFEPTWKRS